MGVETEILNNERFSFQPHKRSIGDIEYWESPGTFVRPYPEIQVYTYADNTIDIPLPQYVAASRAYLPPSTCDMVANLEVALESPHRKVAYGTLPHKALELLRMQTNRVRDVYCIGSEALPLAMRFSWGGRLQSGICVPGEDEAVAVMNSMLETGGADYDRKEKAFDPVRGFYQAYDILKDYYGEHRLSKEPENYTALFLNPHDPGLHEVVGAFKTRFIRSPGYPICFTHLGYEPRARLAVKAIPSNPAMKYMVFEVLLSKAGSREIVVYKCHFTALPDYGQTHDYRFGRANYTWQNDITGEVDHGERVIRFHRAVVEASQKQLGFDDRAWDEPNFAAQALLRGMRVFLLSNPDAMMPDQRMRFTDLVRGDIQAGKDSTSAHSFYDTTIGSLLDKSAALEVMQRGVYYLQRAFVEGKYIDTHHERELIAELGACALADPLAFGVVLRDTRLYTQLEGFNGANGPMEVTHMNALIVTIHQQLCSYFGRSTNRLWDVAGDYRATLAYPRSRLNLDPDGHGILQWETMPDGMSLWVNALEQLRREESQNVRVWGNDYSVFSRFARYFRFRKG